jgi:hypothetical protein
MFGRGTMYLRKNEFGGLRHVKVKYVFANTTAEGKKVKSFTSEHFRASNLINHVTLRIKVKKIPNELPNAVVWI